MFKFEKAPLGRSMEKFESIVGPTLKVQGDLVISQSLRIARPSGNLRPNAFDGPPQRS